MQDIDDSAEINKEMSDGLVEDKAAADDEAEEVPVQNKHGDGAKRDSRNLKGTQQKSTTSSEIFEMLGDLFSLSRLVTT